jgi:hypothetical protein
LENPIQLVVKSLYGHIRLNESLLQPIPGTKDRSLLDNLDDYYLVHVLGWGILYPCSQSRLHSGKRAGSGRTFQAWHDGGRTSAIFKVPGLEGDIVGWELPLSKAWAIFRKSHPFQAGGEFRQGSDERVANISTVPRSTRKPFPTPDHAQHGVAAAAGLLKHPISPRQADMQPSEEHGSQSALCVFWQVCCICGRLREPRGQLPTDGTTGACCSRPVRDSAPLIMTSLFQPLLALHLGRSAVGRESSQCCFSSTCSIALLVYLI